MVVHWAAVGFAMVLSLHTAHIHVVTVVLNAPNWACAGFVKILCKAGTDSILGATVVASDAGNMISEISLAIETATGLGTIAAVIHP